MVSGTSFDLVVNKFERALDEFSIEGVTTTLPLLLAISQSREFRRGFFDTSYTDKNLPMLLEKMQIYKNKKNKFKKEDDLSMVIVEAVKRFEEDLKEEEK